jgi:hypothetical protein
MVLALAATAMTARPATRRVHATTPVVAGQVLVDCLQLELDC